MPKEGLGLNSGALLTLYYLCDLANKDTHIAFPSISTIAKEIGLSPKQVRRHTHLLEKKGLLKIVENRFGGATGKSCRYKPILPILKPKVVDSITTTPMGDPTHSQKRPRTTPSYGSQTIDKPYITTKDLNIKFGFGWTKNPDLAYKAGLEVGIQASPGEDTYSLVNRIFSKLNNLISQKAA
jgi:hypothetical protein